MALHILLHMLNLYALGPEIPNSTENPTPPQALNPQPASMPGERALDVSPAAGCLSQQTQRFNSQTAQSN